MPSFGEALRRERELREISLREITETTKISVRYLEALEANDFETLPGGVFNKGFVRAYCEFIGVDSESMVDAYLLEERARAERGAGADPNVFRRRDPAAVSRAEAAPARDWRRWVLLAGLVLLLLSLLTVGFWLYKRFGAGPPPTDRASWPVAQRPVEGDRRG